MLLFGASGKILLYVIVPVTLLFGEFLTKTDVHIIHFNHKTRNARLGVPGFAMRGRRNFACK